MRRIWNDSFIKCGVKLNKPWWKAWWEKKLKVSWFWIKLELGEKILSSWHIEKPIKRGPQSPLVLKIMNKLGQLKIPFQSYEIYERTHIKNKINNCLI